MGSELMENIENLLSKVALMAEPLLKARLKKRRNIFAGATLPITVVFKSDVETASFHADKQGNVSIRSGALPHPTLVIEGNHSTLCQILQSREPELSAPGPVNVTLSWGPIRNKTINLAEGQIMAHPFKDLYDY
jgi:hypothetical protein